MVKTKRRNNASKTSRRSRRNTRVQRNNNSKRKSNKVRHRKRGGNGDDPKLTPFSRKLVNTLKKEENIKLFGTTEVDVEKLVETDGFSPPSGLTKEQFKYVKILLEYVGTNCINNNTFTIKEECVPLLEHLKNPINKLYPEILDADNKKNPDLYKKLAASEHHTELATFISLIEAYKIITELKKPK